jgi:Mg-chelatase subunit ChlD
MTAGPLTTTQSQLDVILVDSSGSMSPKWWDVLDGIQAYIASLRAANVNSRVLVTTFSSGTDHVIRQRDEYIEDFTAMTDSPLGFSDGSTALYDAINVQLRELRDLDPPRCAITIFTDGEENASKFTSLDQAKAFLDWARHKGWQVTFVGCDFDNSRMAALLGAARESAIGVGMKHLADATKSLAAKRTKYALYGTPMHWTEDEQTAFGGFLAASPPNGTEN